MSSGSESGRRSRSRVLRRQRGSVTSSESAGFEVEVGRMPLSLAGGRGLLLAAGPEQTHRASAAPVACHAQCSLPSRLPRPV